MVFSLSNKEVERTNNWKREGKRAKTSIMGNG
jgi:hypothetical protein